MFHFGNFKAALYKSYPSKNKIRNMGTKFGLQKFSFLDCEILNTHSYRYIIYTICSNSKCSVHVNITLM